MVAELAGVTKTFGSVVAARDVSLALEAGRVTAILGPNGAGKTTVVRLLMGLTRPSRGSARVVQSTPRSVGMLSKPQHGTTSTPRARAAPS